MKSHPALLSIIALAGMHSVAAQDAPTPTPAAASTLLFTPPPSGTAANPSRTPVDMFAQDYDETKDVFLVPGTKEPYNGPVFSRGDNGKLESQGALKNGHEDGLWTEYYADGTKSSEGSYNQGLEEGPWKYWSENGKLASEGAYSEGEMIGRWKTYFDSGAPESEGIYIHGKADGEWKTYDEESGKMAIVKYKDGVQLPH